MNNLKTDLSWTKEAEEALELLPLPQLALTDGGPATFTFQLVLVERLFSCLD